MKKLLSLVLAISLVLPMVMAAHVGTGIGVDIETEDFAPIVWQCDNRVVYDDGLQPDLYGYDDLGYRTANYAFEGEAIEWEVLVMDKNGIGKIEDVFATIGDDQGEGNDIEVNCHESDHAGEVLSSCNARIGEEELVGQGDWDSNVMKYYKCTLTVETPESMYGEYWITVEAIDLDGLSGTMDENEYWFLNPEIALSIEGDLTFEDVRPGTESYSETLLIGNDADDSSGVRLDMFISGSHFYDSSSSGAMCPNTNELNLENFAYSALNGPHDTMDTCGDAEGYCEINVGDQITEAARIMDGENYGDGGLEFRNLLSPGAEMALTFRLDLPEPCNGDFDTGQIFFWGEAI